MVKNKNIFNAIFYCGLISGPVEAYAQSSVTLYGLLETGVRYSTNQTAGGNSSIQMADGVLNPSRWGMTGTEDLGGGMKAGFTLESGLQLRDGINVNGAVGTLNNDDATKSRLFGRLAYVSLSGDFGTINLGRQYTTAFLSACSGDLLCGGGLVVFSPYILYTGLRQDNMVSYQKSFGPFSLSAHYSMGGQPGWVGGNSGLGFGAGYIAGNLSLNAAYQENNLPTEIKARLVTVNGSYKLGAAKLLIGYVGNRLSNGSTQKNDVLYGGISYVITPAVTLSATAAYDRQRKADGSHLLVVGVADYALSKRTSVYFEVDHNSYKDAMLPFGVDAPSGQLGLTLGVRHNF